MMIALFAAALVAQPAQSPPPDPYDTEAAEPSNGVDDVEAAAEEAEEAVEAADEAVDEATEAADEATESAEEAVEEAADAVEEAAEEDEDMVCRRRHDYNEYGRRTSRKVCRPRGE